MQKKSLHVFFSLQLVFMKIRKLFIAQKLFAIFIKN